MANWLNSVSSQKCTNCPCSINTFYLILSWSSQLCLWKPSHLWQLYHHSDAPIIWWWCSLVFFWARDRIALIFLSSAGRTLLVLGWGAGRSRLCCRDRMRIVEIVRRVGFVLVVRLCEPKRLVGFSFFSFCLLMWLVRSFSRILLWLQVQRSNSFQQHQHW